MSDKKHIDRLFQEAFKDFEETPNDAVWERIEAQLKEKKKRRVIPIWWRYAGVAALLLLFLTIGINYFNNSPSTIEAPTQIVDTDENSDLNQTDNNNINEDHINPSNNNSTVKNTEAITNTNNNATETNSEKPNNNSVINKKQDKLNQSNSPTITSVNSEKINDAKKLSSNPKNNEPSQIKDETENSTEIANNPSVNNNTPTETNDPVIDKTKIDNILKPNKSNNDAIADLDNNKSEEITTIPKEEKPNTIEEAIQINKDSDDDEKEDIKRWSVATNAAPVFFNSLGNGSSIDPQFNNNSRSSETNMSYGVSASYAINKRLSVRSGVNKVNLGYNTNDVVVFQSLSGNSSLSFLKNVKPELNNPTNDVSILSAQNFANKSSQSFATTAGINTSINQSLSFIEIPVEIKYLLSDKKLGVNVIGGFSSFFLNDNELSSNFNGNNTSIGEASNVNKTSYSANFGLGLDYNVSKKINLNLEPMFKYQINTFNNTSGDFKPYFIGVYTGFEIKF